jgi:hypothetical protein
VKSAARATRDAAKISRALWNAAIRFPKIMAGGTTCSAQ